jgi:hypothetical protein
MTSIASAGPVGKQTVAQLATAYAVAALVGVSAPAGGQTGTDTLMVALPPAPRVLDGARVRPGSLVYNASLRRADSTVSIGERTVSVVPMSYAGIDAWLLLETTTGPPQYALSDSLVVERATLRLMHWGSYVDFTRGVAEFRSDSMFGGVTSPASRRTIIAPMPGNTLLTASVTEIALSIYPLALDLRDSVTVGMIDPARTMTARAEVAVLGEERVTVGAGTFDCWLVALTTDAGGPTYWVAKNDGMVVRSSRIVPESGGMLTYELVRVSR